MLRIAESDDDHALFARWTPRRYRVVLDSAGGTPCPAATVTFGAPYGVLCATTRLGHTLLGWAASDGVEGALVLPTTPVETPAEPGV
jgi:hypothetical protein